MADFHQAIRWMKEGKVVTRPEFMGGGLIMHERNIQPLDPSKASPALSSICNLEATDWAIHEDVDDWSLLKGPTDLKCQFAGHEISDLKEKILGDLGLPIQPPYAKSISGEEIEKVLDKRFGF